MQYIGAQAVYSVMYHNNIIIICVPACSQFFFYNHYIMLYNINSHIIIITQDNIIMDTHKDMYNW